MSGDQRLTRPDRRLVPGGAGLARRLRVPLWLLAAFGLVLAALSPAAAQDGDDGDETAVPPQVVIFVIDLSGSMNEPFDGSRTKLDVAKDAFVEAFTNVSPTASVGLRVYGDQLASTGAANRGQNCTEDTRLVAPIAEVDRELLIDEVLGFEARGDTAIALALRSANDDIPPDAIGTVVLFSDGRDECFDADLDGEPTVGPSFGEDPCEVARDIAGEGVDLRIDRVETVGFQADEAAEAELRCIADSTGGSYTPIDTPADVQERLPELLAEISSPREAVRLGGQPIVGTPTETGAPELVRIDASEEGDGRYQDTIEMNTEKWYRMTEYGPGSGTLTVTAFGLPAQDGITFDLRAVLVENGQTFFRGATTDFNAGIPRRPTASIRCPGCSITDGPHDLYWIVSLTTDNPALGGTYDLELLTEGPAFGGISTTCEEPQECWYAQEVLIADERLDEVEAEYTNILSSLGADDLIDQRQVLIDQRDTLDTERLDAEAAAAAAEETATLSEGRADQLQVLADDLGPGPAAYALPIGLGAVGVIAGIVGLAIRRKRDEEPSGSEEVPRSVVVGSVEHVPDLGEMEAAQATATAAAEQAPKMTIHPVGPEANPSADPGQQPGSAASPTLDPDETATVRPDSASPPQSPGQQPPGPGSQPQSPGQQPQAPGQQPPGPGSPPPSPGQQSQSPGQQPQSPGQPPPGPGQQPQSSGQQPQSPGQPPPAPGSQHQQQSQIAGSAGQVPPPPGPQPQPPGPAATQGAPGVSPQWPEPLEVPEQGQPQPRDQAAGPTGPGQQPPQPQPEADQTQVSSGPDPGWYADPRQPGFLRWWDGRSWTDHTQPDGGQR